MRTYTKEEWAWIKENLVPMCTGIFKYTYSDTIYNFVITDNLTASFTHSTGNKNWPITSQRDVGNYFWEIFDFKWPDGSDIIPYINYNGTKYNPIVARIKNLDTRFKNKTLKHRFIEKLALP